MPSRRNALALLAAGLLVLVIVGACASAAPTARPSAPSPSSTAAAVRTPAPTKAPATPKLTPVPGGQSEEPVPPPFNPGTTLTDWGRILDAVPDDWPVYPGAKPAEVPDGPNSGAWFTDDGIDDVVAWYQGSLEAAGFTIDNVSSPLEDGSRTVDITTDLPECRIQVTFRPENGSTMIIVMYGAGCLAGDF